MDNTTVKHYLKNREKVVDPEKPQKKYKTFVRVDASTLNPTVEDEPLIPKVRHSDYYFELQCRIWFGGTWINVNRNRDWP